MNATSYRSLALDPALLIGTLWHWACITAVVGLSIRAIATSIRTRKDPPMGYPTPEQRKQWEGIEPGTPPSGPAGASSANPTRPEPSDTTTED